MKLSRNRKGGILPFLLIIAAIGLVIVVGLPSTELLIRWVSLSRVQNAANEAALVYARDIIRLRDNSLSKLNTSNLTFHDSGVPYSCDTQASGGIGSCSPLTGAKASIPGATSLEYLNASQMFLYNIWGERISDPDQVDDVRQFQCYKPYEDQRFAKIESPEPTCVATGKVTSPITGLQWEFTANPYGTGVCCPAPGDNSNKDYCVDVKVTGRMDPIIAGGLPFLSGKGIFENKEEGSPVQFITIGDFEIHARAVVDGMQSQSAAADTENIAGNLSGETVRLESIPNTTCEAAPAPLTPTPNPYTPSNPSALSIPIPGPLPPDSWSVSVPTPDIDIPSPTPDCPPGTEHCQTYSVSDGHVSFQCCPTPPPEESDGGDDGRAPVCPPGKEVVYTEQGLRRQGRTNSQGNPVGMVRGEDYRCPPKTPSDPGDGRDGGSDGGDNCKCPDRVKNNIKGNDRECPHGFRINRTFHRCDNGKRSRTKCAREKICKPQTCTAITDADCNRLHHAVFSLDLDSSKVIVLVEAFEGSVGGEDYQSNMRQQHVGSRRNDTNRLEDKARKNEAEFITCKEEIDDIVSGKVEQEEAYCANKCGCKCRAKSGECGENFGFNSPLVLTLGDDPQVSDEIIEFSFDGKKVNKTKWLSNGSQIGFLFVDLNENGIVDNGTELFGPSFGGLDSKELFKPEYQSFIKNKKKVFKDGFEALLIFKDKNNDSLLKEEELKDLQIWFDKNNDGICEKNEVKSLEDLKVKSLNFKNLEKDKKWIGKNAYLKPIANEGYELEDGYKGIIADIWFKEVK